MLETHFNYYTILELNEILRYHPPYSPLFFEAPYGTRISLVGQKLREWYSEHEVGEKKWRMRKFLTVTERNQKVFTLFHNPLILPLLLRQKDKIEFPFFLMSISRLFPTLDGREVGREQSGMTYFSFCFQAFGCQSLIDGQFRSLAKVGIIIITIY